MEYRLFYPMDESTFKTKWSKRNDIENRIDIYFILPFTSDNFHIENGLKLRNSKKLELKKRKKRLDNGQEYWIKTIRSYRKIQIDDMDSIIRVLKQSNEQQLVEQLTNSEPKVLCYVDKYRQQKSIGNNLLEEITGLHLKFLQSNKQIGNDLYFETICIEQLNADLIDENILKNFSKTNENNPMGYPEFLFQQYQQIIQ